jgi:hypothetical protein
MVSNILVVTLKILGKILKFDVDWHGLLAKKLWKNLQINN